jgi:MGT family glycosyltransferase
MLVDTALCIETFICNEVDREKPDFIIHSHLAIWGKLVSRHFNIPSITLYTTFVLDKRVMLPFFRDMNQGTVQSRSHIVDALNFQRKCSSLYNRLNLQERPDLWDAYVNKGDLNISFILKHFQHQSHLLRDDFHFVGYPTTAEPLHLRKELIYISMGTIFNENLEMYQVCIDILAQLQLQAVLSVGSLKTIAKLRNTSRHIKLEASVDQRDVLKRARLFITRGGMASVHEAIYTGTPMIVIPIIPEQQLTSQKVAALNIGITIAPHDVCHDTLKNAIMVMLNGYDTYARNIQSLRNEIPQIPAEESATNLIQQFLHHRVTAGKSPRNTEHSNHKTTTPLPIQS